MRSAASIIEVLKSSYAKIVPTTPWILFAFPRRRQISSFSSISLATILTSLLLVSPNCLHLSTPLLFHTVLSIQLCTLKLATTPQELFLSRTDRGFTMQSPHSLKGSSIITSQVTRTRAQPYSAVEAKSKWPLPAAEKWCNLLACFQTTLLTLIDTLSKGQMESWNVEGTLQWKGWNPISHHSAGAN